MMIIVGTRPMIQDFIITKKRQWMTLSVLIVWSEKNLWTVFPYTRQFLYDTHNILSFRFSISFNFVFQIRLALLTRYKLNWKIKYINNYWEKIYLEYLLSNMYLLYFKYSSLKILSLEANNSSFTIKILLHL